MAAANIIGIVDCPNLRMYADFLTRRGYTVVFFLDAGAAVNCSLLLFCWDHLLVNPAIQSAGRRFEGPKLLLNVDPPVDWSGAHRLNLPLLPLELENKISSLLENAPEAQTSHRILIIEDDVTVAMTLVRSFQEIGFQVRVCRGFAELAASLQQHSPELIVMDLNLPGLSGEKLGEMLRKQKIPVVIFSSERPDRLEEAKRRIGAVAAFSKDTPQRTMREWIRTYLSKQ